MTMKMTRAFNSRMLTKLVRHFVTKGKYVEDNIWEEGKSTSKSIKGVVTAGNKFSQFEEGQALHAEDGGVRYSDFRSLYVPNRFSIELGDKIEFSGNYFNVLQRSDESVFGFHSYIIEKSKSWRPDQ